MTDLLALVCDVYSDYVTFSFGFLGQVWYLIVSIPDPCCLSFFINKSSSIFKSNCVLKEADLFFYLQLLWQNTINFLCLDTMEWSNM